MNKDYSSSIGFVMVTAFSFTFIHYLSATMNSQAILFIGCLTAIVFFHAVNYKTLGFIYKTCWGNKLDWLNIMILVFISWTSAFYATTLKSAFVYIFLAFLSAGACGFYHHMKNREETRKNKYLFIASMILTALFIKTSIVLDYSHEIVDLTSLAAYALAIVSGVSGFYYSKTSSSFMQKHDFSVTQMLAVRFWVLLAFAGIFVPLSFHSTIYSLSAVLSCVGIGVLSFILPIYLFQHGVLKIGVNKNAIFRSATPFVAALLQFGFGGTFDYNIIFSVLLTMLVVIAYLPSIRIDAYSYKT